VVRPDANAQPAADDDRASQAFSFFGRRLAPMQESERQWGGRASSREKARRFISGIPCFDRFIEARGGAPQ
jgi:hypothetical protein